jgi:putative MATE family efflux protein
MDARDRTILRLAVPALATLAIEPLYVLVDTAIVGHLGRTPLGGVALAATALNTIFFVVTVLEYGITARVAFHLGGKRPRQAAGVMVQGLWLSVAAGIGLAAIVAAGARPIATALGGHGHPDVLDAAVTYLRISAVGAPLLLVGLVGIGYLRGIQDTRTPLWIALAANLVNVVLEITFVYGLDLGVAGSAWSTVVAQAVAAGWYLAILSRHAAANAAPTRPDRGELQRLVRSGGHLSIRTGALLGTLAVFTAVAARIDDVTLGGHQIALQIETFLALVVDGLAIAAQALVATALGAHDVDEARAVGRRLLQWGALLGVMLAVVLALASQALPTLFTGDADVRDRAATGLLFVALLQVPASFVFVLDGVLLGAGDDAFQGWSNVVAFVAAVPVAAAVLARPSLGIAGVWVGMNVWMVARLVANAARFTTDAWTHNLETPATPSSI